VLAALGAATAAVRVPAGNAEADAWTVRGWADVAIGCVALDGPGFIDPARRDGPGAFSGLDEQLNENPWKVDFHRKNPKHNTFGDGPHRCAGMHLARMEITVTLQEWLARIPRFRMVESDRPIYSSGMVATVENVHLKWDPAANGKVAAT